MEQTEIEQLVGEAENRVERLRSLYDQYFMGIERIEPQIARKDVERRIQILRRTQIRNTALRFRFQNVLLRYNTFAAHWMRICRQIEEGTYKHHLRKAKERFDPHAQAREARAARKREAALEFGDTEPPSAGSPGDFDADDMDIDVDFDEGLAAPDVRAALRTYSVPKDVVASSVAGHALSSMTAGAKPAPPAPKAAPPLPGRPAPPPVAERTVPPPLPNRAAAGAPHAGPAPAVVARPAPLPGARPAPAPTSADRLAARPAAKAPVDPSALSDERVRQIYSKYVETRRSLKETSAAITIDGMAKSLRDSSEKLRQKHVGKAVDFEVQVKDGKAVLKPIVR